jgi:hypothetical protein
MYARKKNLCLQASIRSLQTLECWQRTPRYRAGLESPHPNDHAEGVKCCGCRSHVLHASTSEQTSTRLQSKVEKVTAPNRLGRAVAQRGSWSIDERRRR